jgi:hypothetical protein
MTTPTDPVSENKIAGRQAATRVTAVTHGLATLQELLDHVGIVDWDALIVGDGSGQNWDMGTGWASVLIDRYSRAAKAFFGGFNVGTVTLGEMMPYLHALLWYTDKGGPGRQRRQEATRANRQMQIHIVTDSEIVAKAGNNACARHSHQMLWAAFDACQNQGYVLTFHHVGRDVINLNVLVDELSRQARVALDGTYSSAIKVLQSRYPGIPDDATIYEFFS